MSAKKCLAASILALCATWASAADIERSIFGSATTPPLWVSSRAAFDRKGNLRPELFEPGLLRQLEDDAHENQRGDCRSVIGAPVIEDFTPKRNLDDLVASALAIVQGRVTAAEPGFYGGIPGTLFTVTPEAVTKNLGHLRASSPFRLFVVHATFSTPQGMICSDEPFGTVPQIGDRLVLFIATDPINIKRDIITVDVGKQVVVERKGVLHLPPALAKSLPSARSASDVIRSTRENAHVNDVPPRAGGQ